MRHILACLLLPLPRSSQAPASALPVQTLADALAYCQQAPAARASASVSAQARAAAAGRQALPVGNHGENHPATVTTDSAQDLQP